MDDRQTVIRNEDIETLGLDVPEGHRHLRATITLRDGREIVLQEATVANLVRAYVTVKTHPVKTSVTMKAERPESMKEGYAAWQLLETKED